MGVGWLSNYCKLRCSSCFGILRRSISRIDLVIRLKGGKNLFFWAKIGPRNPVIVQKWYLVNRYRRKLVDPSKWPQEFSYYGCSKIYILLRQVKVPKKCLISFFRHYMMKLWKFPYHENYMPYQIGWPLIFLASDIFCRPCPKFFSITTLYKST